MEPEDPLLCLQESTTGSLPVVDKFIPQMFIHFA